MFVDAGHNFRIYCDYKSQSVRVMTNIFPPQFKPQYAEVTAFAKEEKWYDSSYAKQISSEQLQEDIAWFWADMESTHNTPPAAEDPSLGASR